MKRARGALLGKIAGVVLVAAMLLLLLGCGDDSDTTTTAAPITTVSEAPTTTVTESPATTAEETTTSAPTTTEAPTTTTEALSSAEPSKPAGPSRAWAISMRCGKTGACATSALTMWSSSAERRPYRPPSTPGTSSPEKICPTTTSSGTRIRSCGSSPCPHR